MSALTTAEGLRYYVVDGKARWSPPPEQDDEHEDDAPQAARGDALTAVAAAKTCWKLA